MKFFQESYRHLLIVGLLTYFLLYACCRKLVFYFLRYSSAGLCAQHVKGTREEHPATNGHSAGLPNDTCQKCQNKKVQLVAEISEKCVGLLNALNCTVASCFVLRDTRHDVLQAQSPVMIPFVLFTITYFLYDIVAMYNSFASREENSGLPVGTRIWKLLKKRHAFIAHHIILLLLGYPLGANYENRNGTGDFFIACFNVGELANHFINASHILRLLDWHNSVLFKVNSVLLVVSFLLSRILILPYMYWQYFQQMNVSWTEALGSMKSICHAGMTLIVVFQIFWAFTIVRTGLKIRKKKLPEKEKTT